MGNKVCEVHKIPLGKVACHRCDGDGYTEWDIEERDNPLSSSDGSCYRCRGSGTVTGCADCEEEAHYQMLNDEYDEQGAPNHGEG